MRKDEADEVRAPRGGRSINSSRSDERCQPTDRISNRKIAGTNTNP